MEENYSQNTEHDYARWRTDRSKALRKPANRKKSEKQNGNSISLRILYTIIFQTAFRIVQIYSRLD